MDALILARMQFAANITFHILFPTISIALGWLLLFFRLRWLKARTGTDTAAAQGWLDAYRFWTKVFALTFARQCRAPPGDCVDPQRRHGSHS